MCAYAAANLPKSWYTGVKHISRIDCIRNGSSMKINLPDDVKFIIDTLTENGYEAYAVGGCVRDSIIHREPEDWDITTSAKPAEVKKLFRRTIDTGIQHGTVTIMLKKKGYEVTTYRLDGEYEDSRHPKSVEFTASLVEDLKRRDFTINAMAYNDNDGLVDEFGGRDDLKNGIIRCVGNPEDRFREDALRMLRAVRFSAQLGFDIDSNTANAIKTLVSAISKISKERIHTELGKLLLSPHPEYVEKVCELGIASVVFKPFDSVEDKTIPYSLINYVPARLPFRYAALLYSCGDRETGRILKELKLDNNTINKTVCLVKNHGLVITEDWYLIRLKASEIGADALEEVLVFEECFYRVAGQSQAAAAIARQREILDIIIKRGDCLSINDLAVNGKDLMELGVKPGKQMGQLLEACLDLVLKEPKRNNREELIGEVIRQQ